MQLQQSLSRRHTLRLALGTAATGLAAITSACGASASPTAAPSRAPSSPTTTPATAVAPAVSVAASPTGAPSGAGSVSSAVTTGASPSPTGTRASGASAPSGGTPAGGTAASDLLRMLAFMPLDKPEQIFSLAFAGIGVAKRRYGLAGIRSEGDLQAQHVPLDAYLNATRGCNLSDFTGGSFSANGVYRDAFGYDVYQVDREIWAGQPPDYFSHMEGAFDVDTIIAKLRAGGYAPASHDGTTFFTIRDDYKQDLQDPRSLLAFARLNRIAVSTERIIAAPATGLITAALDAEAMKRPALDTFPTTYALATALGDVTSMATMRPPTDDLVTAVLDPDRFATTTAMTRDWGTLHLAELTALGYTDAGNDKRTIHAALVYTRPADATADAPELAKRLKGYQSTRTGQPLIPTLATSVTTRTMTVNGKGVLIADITQTPEPARAGLWRDMLYGRDTLFLVPTPLGANGTPVPTISLPGSPGTTVTPRP